MNIFILRNIEKIYLTIYLIGSFYVIYNNPVNIIPLSIYAALLYIPVNILMIKEKQKENIDIPDFEIGHRIIFLAIGLIPILAIFSDPTNRLLTFG